LNVKLVQRRINEIRSRLQLFLHMYSSCLLVHTARRLISRDRSVICEWEFATVAIWIESLKSRQYFRVCRIRLFDSKPFSKRLLQALLAEVNFNLVAIAKDRSISGVVCD